MITGSDVPLEEAAVDAKVDARGRIALEAHPLAIGIGVVEAPGVLGVIGQRHRAPPLLVRSGGRDCTGSERV
jgi:hypothetical protein